MLAFLFAFLSGVSVTLAMTLRGYPWQVNGGLLATALVLLFFYAAASQAAIENAVRRATVRDASQL